MQEDDMIQCPKCFVYRPRTFKKGSSNQNNECPHCKRIKQDKNKQNRKDIISMMVFIFIISMIIRVYLL